MSACIKWIRELVHHVCHCLAGNEFPNTITCNDDAASIADTIRSKFEAGEFDVCTLIFNKFKNAITQEITLTRLIPAEVDESDAADNDAAAVSYEYEPEEDELLASLLPRNLSTQIYSALLESSAAELAARMTGWIPPLV